MVVAVEMDLHNLIVPLNSTVIFPIENYLIAPQFKHSIMIWNPNPRCLPPSTCWHCAAGLLLFLITGSLHDMRYAAVSHSQLFCSVLFYLRRTYRWTAVFCSNLFISSSFRIKAGSLVLRQFCVAYLHGSGCMLFESCWHLTESH